MEKFEYRNSNAQRNGFYCTYIQRQKPGEVLARFQKLKPGDAAISVITWGALLYGAEKSQLRKKVYTSKPNLFY